MSAVPFRKAQFPHFAADMSAAHAKKPTEKSKYVPKEEDPSKKKPKAAPPVDEIDEVLGSGPTISLMGLDFCKEEAKGSAFARSKELNWWRRQKS